MSLDTLLIRRARKLIAEGYCTQRDVKLLATLLADAGHVSEAGASPIQVEATVQKLSEPDGNPDGLEWANATAVAQQGELPMGETWLVWYAPMQTDDGIRLLVPHSDPHEHELPIDFLFESKQQAYEALDDYDVADEAREQGWVLCRKTLVPIERCNPPWFRNFYRCPECSETWDDEHSCTCNDECPNCGLGDVQPFASEDIPGDYHG